MLLKNYNLDCTTSQQWPRSTQNKSYKQIQRKIYKRKTLGHSRRHSPPAALEEWRRQIKVEQKRLLILLLGNHKTCNVLQLVTLVLRPHRHPGSCIRGEEQGQAPELDRSGESESVMGWGLGFRGSEHRGNNNVGEVGFGLGPSERSGSGVVGPGGFLGGVEGSEPLSGLFPGITDLGGETAPGTLADASVVGLFGRRRRVFVDWKRVGRHWRGVSG